MEHWREREKKVEERARQRRKPEGGKEDRERGRERESHSQGVLVRETVSKSFDQSVFQRHGDRSTAEEAGGKMAPEGGGGAKDT